LRFYEHFCVEQVPEKWSTERQDNGSTTEHFFMEIFFGPDDAGQHISNYFAPPCTGLACATTTSIERNDKKDATKPLQSMMYVNNQQL
jgi:hypothetical protein